MSSLYISEGTQSTPGYLIAQTITNTSPDSVITVIVVISPQTIELYHNRKVKPFEPISRQDTNIKKADILLFSQPFLYSGEGWPASLVENVTTF